MFRLLAKTVCFVMLLLLSPMGVAEETIKSELAPLSASDKPLFSEQTSSISFEFSGGSITIRRDGTWEAESQIHHQGLRCGKYQLGFRLGEGDALCSEVNWLVQAYYLKPIQHCNNATRLHGGDGFIPEYQKNFNKLNCAERLIKCEGLCRP